MERSHADESTPLLNSRTASQSHPYTRETNNSVDHDFHTSFSSAASTLDDDQAAVDCTAASPVSHGLLDEPEGSLSKEDTGYAARFINLSPARFWLIFSGILMGNLIAFFDSTLMASSHPVITSYFHASNSASWLSTAFLLTSTAFLPLFGRISDTFGRRPVYLFSIIVFFFTTLWCAVAQSIGSFIAARAFCGLGAGGVLSLSMILSSDMVRIEYRGVYQSYINLVLGAGGCLGLVFGGYLCEKVGWRGAFFVQLPFIFVHFFVAAWATPADLGLKKTKPEGMTLLQLIKNIDLVGSVILVVCLTSFIMGINLGGNVFSWAHPLVISSFVLSLILTVIFVRYERTVERAVMPIELLSSQPRASLIFGNFFGSISTNTVMFNVPLYFQAVKLVSPSESGFKMVACTLAITISSVSTGFLITWTKHLKPFVIIGEVVFILGGCAAAAIGVNTPDLLAMICVSLSSLGQGFSFPSLTVSVLATSHQEEQAVATTTLTLWRSLGAIMGVSISSWIFQNTLAYRLQEMVTGPNKEDVILLVRKSVQAIPDLDLMHQQQG